MDNLNGNLSIKRIALRRVLHIHCPTCKKEKAPDIEYLIQCPCCEKVFVPHKSKGDTQKYVMESMEDLLYVPK